MSASDPMRFFEASALRLQQITHLPLTAFVAYDARLLASAAAEGLTTI